jgi:hypothetical protein
MAGSMSFAKPGYGCAAVGIKVGDYNDHGLEVGDVILDVGSGVECGRRT